MKRYLVALGLAAGLTGCTLPTVDDLIEQQVGKLTVDQDVALAYTELAMKQIGQSAAAVTSGVPSGGAPAAPRIGRAAYRPLFKALAVTADQCVQYTDVACTDAGVCSYTEDYTACGSDFGGKIVREFSGTYETYSIKVDFQNYAEKPTTEAKHYAFNGKSSIDGQLGFESATLALHTDGEAASRLADRLVHVKSSATINFKGVGTTLTIDGTQSGTLVETGQAGTLTITELTFDDTCTQGPVKGTVKTIIDNVETITTITGCGQGTIVVAGGEAQPIDGAKLADTFLPEEGSEDAGFGGITDGTSGSSLLSGDWQYSDAQTMKNFSIYEYDGQAYIYYNESFDETANGMFYDDGDTYQFGSGMFSYDDTNITIAWDYYKVGTVDSINGDYYQPYPTSCDNYVSGEECSNLDPTVVAYSLVGSDSLTIGDVTYTRVGYDYGSGEPDICQAPCAPKQ